MVAVSEYYLRNTRKVQKCYFPIKFRRYLTVFILYMKKYNSDLMTGQKAISQGWKPEVPALGNLYIRFHVTFSFSPMWRERWVLGKSEEVRDCQS